MSFVLDPVGLDCELEKVAVEVLIQKVVDYCFAAVELDFDYFVGCDFDWIVDYFGYCFVVEYYFVLVVLREQNNILREFSVKVLEIKSISNKEKELRTIRKKLKDLLVTKKSFLS